MGVGNFDPLPASELLQAVRQILGPGHGRAVNEDWDDANVALERRLNLDAHKVMGMVQATLVPRVGARAPTRADYRDEGIASPDPLGEDINEIFSEFDIVDVEKNAFASKPFREAIINAACEAAGIVSPIADEDAAQHLDALAAWGD
jgi:hypothetical protein